MTIFNENFLPIIQKHVDKIKAQGKSEFYTMDVIKDYIGHYHSDETNVHDSINANIGRFLGENAGALGIVEKAAHQSVTDKDGHPTTSALWAFK